MLTFFLTFLGLLWTYWIYKLFRLIDKTQELRRVWLDTYSTGAQSEIFVGREGFVKLGHFDKHFVKNSRKKIAPQGKIFFLLNTLKTTFWVVNLTSGWTQSGHFSLIFRKEQETPPPFPLVARLFYYDF